MSILPITVYGDKVLREKAQPVEKIDDRIVKNVTDMFATMRNADGGIGLAANQVGFNDKIFVLDLSPIEEYKNEKPIVMVNPEIIDSSDETEIMEEGCLSLPYLRADVERPAAIKVKFLDMAEEEQILEVDDFFARAVQHEYDHLIGKMIPDRVDSRTKTKIKRDLLKIMKRQIDVHYPITEK